MPLTAGETYYSLDEAAVELGLALQTVRNYVTAGTIKGERLGSLRGSVLVSKDELARFRAAKKPRGNPNLQKRLTTKAD